MATQEQKDFINSVENLITPLINLMVAYESIDDKSNYDTSFDYPFTGSFDEWFHEFLSWRDSLYKKWVAGITEYSPTITVGDIKRLISNLPDHTQITVQKDDGWLNITEAQIPDNESFFTIVFKTEDNFSTRQI